MPKFSMWFWALAALLILPCVLALKKLGPACLIVPVVALLLAYKAGAA